MNLFLQPIKSNTYCKNMTFDLAIFFNLIPGAPNDI